MPECLSHPPPVTWAQRKNLIYLSICLEDCKNPVIKLEPGSLYFKGVGGTDKKEHEVKMEFYKEITPEESKYSAGGRIIEFRLQKKEEGPFWPHLLKDKAKQHWLKIDFAKWKDEDDSDDDETQNFDEMFKNMGGFDGAGDRPDLGDLDVDGDSDDEELPELQ